MVISYQSLRVELSLLNSAPCRSQSYYLCSVDVSCMTLSWHHVSFVFYWNTASRFVGGNHPNGTKTGSIYQNPPKSNFHFEQKTWQQWPKQEAHAWICPLCRIQQNWMGDGNVTVPFLRPQSHVSMAPISDTCLPDDKKEKNMACNLWFVNNVWSEHRGEKEFLQSAVTRGKLRFSFVQTLQDSGEIFCCWVFLYCYSLCWSFPVKCVTVEFFQNANIFWLRVKGAERFDTAAWSDVGFSFEKKSPNLPRIHGKLVLLKAVKNWTGLWNRI